MTETGLILEGGARRGVFTSGVLDYFMEHGLYLPYVAGASAGACNAIDYVSRQIGRTRDCMIPKERSERYVSVGRTLRKRTLFDMDMVFDEFPRRTYPFDFETYFASPIRCDIVLTNCLTGKAEYVDERADKERLLKLVRASSSLPVLTKIVVVDGVPYCDGGVADSVPLFHAMRNGHKKNIVILTRNPGYRKSYSARSQRIYRVALRGYPELRRTLAERHIAYNRLMAYLEEQEREKTGRVLVIRPTLPPIRRAETNKGRLNAFYLHGYEMAKARWKEIKHFVES